MPNIYLIFKHSSIYLFAQSKFKQIYNEDEVTFLPFSQQFPTQSSTGLKTEWHLARHIDCD